MISLTNNDLAYKRWPRLQTMASHTNDGLAYKQLPRLQTKKLTKTWFRFSSLFNCSFSKGGFCNIIVTALYVFKMKSHHTWRLFTNKLLTLKLNAIKSLSVSSCTLIAVDLFVAWTPRRFLTRLHIDNFPFMVANFWLPQMRLSCFAIENPCWIHY